LIRDGDYFLPVCNHFKEVLRSMGVPADKIEVHYSGIDLDKFPFAPEHERPSGACRVLAVGRLVEKKGYTVLLEAISQLTASGRVVRLTIIGDGPLRQRIVRRIEDLGLSDSVTLRGWVSHDAMASEMYSHDVLAAPSLTTASGELEGIPNVLKEAMASGLPVVCTRHSGIPDLVTDGETGFLVPEGDADALAACLAKVMEHTSPIETMRLRARTHVEALMSMDRLNDRLLTIYGMLAANKEGIVRG
jgi:colanic acid/amylovoran biosynthesis glycosyltransferase